MAYQYHHQDHALGMDPAAAAGNPGGDFAPGLGAGGWEREKAAIEAHPLYERLLEAHVACLRVATPVDQLPRIDVQIAARAPPPVPPRRRARRRRGARPLHGELLPPPGLLASRSRRVRTPRAGWAGLPRACSMLCVVD